MFTRIVKMSFETSKIETFLENFNKSKEGIRNFKGCRLLEIYRDKNNPNIFFSYSRWESEHDLNSYRNSDFFKNIWKETKLLFNDKPQAWSVDTIESLK